MSQLTPRQQPNLSPAEPTAVPPDEEFWQKYSPHFEFPISTVATVALHVAAIAIIIYITTRLMKSDEMTPVPIRSVVIGEAALGDSAGTESSGGGEAKVEANDDRPQEPQRKIPEAELQREIISASTWIPELKDNPEALKTIVESSAFKNLNAVNNDLKKRLAQGFTGKRGQGEGTGAGASGAANTGAGPGAGDPTSSGNRSCRWVIMFSKTTSEHYLRQLAAYEAQIIVPEPPDWEKNRIFENLSVPGPGRLLTEKDELAGMRFVSDKESAGGMARALGLNFTPPYFVAFFPKRVEEELAAKERAYRNRREDQIKETTFRVLERNGRYEIKVIDQVPAR